MYTYQVTANVVAQLLGCVKLLVTLLALHLPIDPVRLSSCIWVVRQKTKLAAHIYLLCGEMG